MHKVLRTLILSDLFIIGSFGLIQPIFAVFMLRQIGDATLASVGLALSIALFTKGLFQILVGRFDDEERGNRRELYTLTVGSILISLTPLGYLFAQSSLHVYLTQFLYGIGMALSYPSWRVMFTRYLRHDKEGYEWSLYDTIVSLVTAGAAAMGAVIAEQYSFNFLFISVAALSLVGTAFIVHMFREEFTTLGQDTKKARRRR